MVEQERTPPGGGRMATEESPQEVVPEHYADTVGVDLAGLVKGEGERRVPADSEPAAPTEPPD